MGLMCAEEICYVAEDFHKWGHVFDAAISALP